MKTRLLAIAMLLCTFAAKAQYVTIPDTTFATYLQQNYPACMNGNQMDTTCNEIVNALGVDISDKEISDVEGIQYFDNLSNFYCRNNQITFLPVLPATLYNFDCTNNAITALSTPLPPALNSLICSQNQISSFPPLPNSLTVFYCEENSGLSSLPNLPNSLETFVCGYNYDITALPMLPAGLKFLSAHDMSLTSLPTLPSTLTSLSISNNQISTLPTLPNILETLEFSYNPISTMPQYPDSLYVLVFSGTDINTLPYVPQRLGRLDCAWNNLTSLPTLPVSLYSLNCSNNNLSNSIPELPNLIYLTCNNNNFTQIGPFADTMQFFLCQNNPNLSCLPRVKRIVQTLNYNNTAVVCLPNAFTIGFNNSTIDTLPICNQFNNPNGCTIYANITGRSYTDRNNNCAFDGTDVGQYGLKHSLYSNGILLEQTYSNEVGTYSFDETGLGNYATRLDTTGLPFIIACPIGGVHYDTLTANDSTHFNRDFALQCETGFDLAAHSVASNMLFRPANNTVVDIRAGDLANFYSASCAQGVSGVVTVTLNGPMTYISPASGAVAPSNVANNVLTWNVADFGTADALHDFNIIIQTDTFAQAGQQACFDVSVTPLTGDNDTSNNHTYYCFDIVNSYDPNDKTAYPSGNIDTTQEWLTYTVRFQNTGNAEAQHIYIMDTLDANVKEETFQLLSYSHQPNVQINENIVRFNFPFINLPDSTTNEPGSHGYVQYKVKLKEDLVIGTAINNTAYIYFDFNPPVVTNTATNTIAVEEDTVVGIRSISKTFDLLVYPNPANQQVTIVSSEQNSSITIYNMQGRMMLTHNIVGTAATINISHFASGLYYIGSGNSNVRKKLVKL